jgi:hypothetical protein
VPAALTFTPVIGPLNLADDVPLVLTPIVRLSLDSLRGGGTVHLTYVVPQSPQWDRIRQHERLGHHEYIAFVADKLHGQLLAFSPLGIELSVVTRNAPVPLARSRTDPFLYASSSANADAGVTFVAMPGDRLEIAIKARDAKHLPEGELIVEPYVDGSAKDVSEIERGLDAMFKPVVSRSAQIGLVLLAVGVALRAAAYFWTGTI